MSLRVHPHSKQYSFGVLIKRIIESAKLAICWVKAQREEIYKVNVLIRQVLFSLSWYLLINEVITIRRKHPISSYLCRYDL